MALTSHEYPLCSCQNLTPPCSAAMTPEMTSDTRMNVQNITRKQDRILHITVVTKHEVIQCPPTPQITIIHTFSIALFPTE